MPSKTKAQHNLMAMVANDPAAAKRMGVPQSVGKDFLQADKGKKFGSVDKTRVDSQRVNKPKTEHGGKALFSKGGEMKESKVMIGKEMAFMKKKGAPKSMIKHEMAEAGMKKGGMPMIMKDGKKVPAFAVKKMASGGSVSARADGIAVKGKTKGKMLAKGGRAC